MRIITAVFAAVTLLAPALTIAHGGVSNQAGNAVVFLTQQPLSPLVGEEVLMTFSLKDRQLQALPGVTVSLRLVETGSDPSQDRVVLTETKTADVNGNFDFTYKFGREGYFDVELALPDPVTAEPLVIGFLVQPRDPVVPWLKALISAIIVIGAAATYAFIKAKKPIQ